MPKTDKNWWADNRAAIESMSPEDARTFRELAELGSKMNEPAAIDMPLENAEKAVLAKRMNWNGTTQLIFSQPNQKQQAELRAIGLSYNKDDQKTEDILIRTTGPDSKYQSGEIVHQRLFTTGHLAFEGPAPFGPDGKNYDAEVQVMK